MYKQLATLRRAGWRTLALGTMLASRAEALPVFPGATGFGTETVGGSGRHENPPRTTVRRVTTLADSGPGSLRECVEATGARTCVFEVSGRVRLKSLLRVRNPYLTIAGQTAPAPGIVISDHGLRIQTRDVLVRHIQLLFGDRMPALDRDNLDGISVGGTSTKPAYNVVLDHCSVGWALDEGVTVWAAGTNRVTLMNSIVAEGLDCSVHPEGCHSAGVFVTEGVSRVSIHDNLVAMNQDRNPRFKAGTSGEVVNNVVYGWGASNSNLFNLSDTARANTPLLVNAVGNFYRPAPWSAAGKPALYANPVSSKTKVYLLSNVGPGRPIDSGDEWKFSGISTSYRSSGPVIPLSNVPPTAPADSYSSVLAKAGSRPRERNALDARIVREVKAGSGSIKDCVSGCTKHAGGWPSMTSLRRTLSVPSSPMSLTSSGYTKLEEWLDGYARSVQ